MMLLTASDAHLLPLALSYPHLRLRDHARSALIKRARLLERLRIEELSPPSSLSASMDLP